METMDMNNTNPGGPQGSQPNFQAGAQPGYTQAGAGQTGAGQPGADQAGAGQTGGNRFQPWVGSYQAQAGGYQPPAGGYCQPPTQGQVGKGGGWIGLLRVVLWLEFAMFVIVGLYGFSTMADYEPLMGLLTLAGSVLVGLLVVGGGMVALDAAANIQRCATNSARILDHLGRK